MTKPAFRCRSFDRCAWILGLFVVLLWTGMPQPAQAQSPSIEELEQRLQKAREEKARRDAAAAKANADAARAAAKPAAPANTGRLVVEVDAACELRVNGERVRSFNAADTAVITVPAGEQLIECMSTAQPGARARKVIEVSSGKQAVLTLSVLAAEGPARAADATAKRFQVVSDSVVLDTQGSVQWTRSDNGRDVNWSQAQAHCQGMGSGWSLPTVAQLQSLYDKNLPGIPCGTFTCKVSNQFRLSNFWFWSSESNGSSEAWGVALGNGDRDSTHVGYGILRALCVRRP
jgi:hypothetical protein